MSDIRTFEPWTREQASMLLRPFDEGVMDFFRPTLKSRSIPRILIPPDRAFDSLNELHQLSNGGNLVLPAVSFQRTDFQINLAKYSPCMVRRKEDSKVVSEDGNAVLTYLFPIPYDLTYQIDVWAVEEAELNLLIEYFLTKQNRFRFLIIPVDLKGHIGVQQFSAEYDSFSNNIEAEAGEVDRRLRYSITMRLSACLWRNDQKMQGLLKQADMSIQVVPYTTSLEGVYDYNNPNWPRVYNDFFNVIGKNRDTLPQVVVEFHEEG